MESQLMTVVFIDVQGFTRRTANQSQSETELFIKETRAFVEQHLEKWSGTLVKTMGDGFLCSFTAPSKAVQCGLEMQRKLEGRNANVLNPDNFVRFRIGINTGEVSIDEHGDLFGDTVNIAARIEGFAEPNEVFISEATFLAMNRNEFGTEDLGPQMFKNATREIRVYKIVRDGPGALGGSVKVRIGTAGTPAAGTPAAGTPAAGTPAAGTPGSAGKGGGGTPVAGPAAAAGAVAVGPAGVGRGGASASAGGGARPPWVYAVGGALAVLVLILGVPRLVRFLRRGGGQPPVQAPGEGGTGTAVAVAPPGTGEGTSRPQGGAPGTPGSTGHGQRPDGHGQRPDGGHGHRPGGDAPPAPGGDGDDLDLEEPGEGPAGPGPGSGRNMPEPQGWAAKAARRAEAGEKIRKTGGEVLDLIARGQGREAVSRIERTLEEIRGMGVKLRPDEMGKVAVALAAAGDPRKAQKILERCRAALAARPRMLTAFDRMVETGRRDFDRMIEERRRALGEEKGGG